MANRPRRTKKSDRLLACDATNQERQCDYGIAPFDRRATEMENKWGIDRLPELVSPDTAARYGRLMADLMDALNAADPEKVRQLATIGIRALNAMDAEATAAGHTTEAAIWEIEHEGFRFVILEDERQWPELQRQNKERVYFTKTEVALAMKAYSENPMLAAIKGAFPEAEIKSTDPIGTHKSPGFWKNGGDEIDFH